MSILLRKGSVGPHVRQLKQRLNAAGAALPDTSTFDAATHDAVVAFQKTHKLEPDGVVGERTWDALGGPPALPVEHANIRGFQIAMLACWEAARAVREVGGDDRGPDVEKYQRVTGALHDLWCASFVSWCYLSCGVGLLQGNGSARVKALREWGEKYGHWRERTPGYTPPSGAIVIFTWSHTGIVVAGGASDDRTVEGNSWSGNQGDQRNGNGVYMRVRPHREVRGYVVVPEIVL